MSAKQRPDAEVLSLLNQHEVPEELTLQGYYAQVNEQVNRLSRLAPDGRSRFGAGQIAESFARSFGFSHWVTLRYLLRRRDKIRRRRNLQPPRQVEIPQGLSQPQLDYLKKLRWRKAELVRIELQGRSAEITHRTESGQLITYLVDAKGGSRYLSQTGR